MKKFIIKFCIAVYAVYFFIATSTPTHAQERNDDTGVAKISDLETVIFPAIVSVVGILFGFVFFAMMVMGGIRFLMSGGDPKAVAAAKGTITYAIAGLAFMALSYTILLLIGAFTGVDVTIFRIIQP